MSIRKNTLPTTALSSKSFRAFSDKSVFSEDVTFPSDSFEDVPLPTCA